MAIGLILLSLRDAVRAAAPTTIAVQTVPRRRAHVKTMSTPASGIDAREPVCAAAIP
jgi:hypothetical protein